MELERLGRETAAARKPAERSGGRTLARQMRRALKEIGAGGAPCGGMAAG